MQTSSEGSDSNGDCSSDALFRNNKNIYLSLVMNIRYSYNMELNDFEKKIIAHIMETPSPGRHAVRSALRHLERAWKLVDDMPELAYFCAITAEEESATALFHSLNRRKYKGASSLKPRNHVHKTALHPFLYAIKEHFSQIDELPTVKLEFNLDLSPNKKELLRVRLEPPDSDKWLYPLPPLDFSSKLDGEVYFFSEELSQIAANNNFDDIFKYVKNVANARNELLYATPSGIAHVDKKSKEQMKDRHDAVFFHFVIYLLIDPYHEKQLFVQQALDAFLKMLRIIEK